MSSDAHADTTDDTPDHDTLRTHLQALAAHLGKTPTVMEMHEQGDYHPEQYADAFGSWDGALDAAGLDPKESAHKIPDHDLLADLQRLYTELGRTPTLEDVDKHGEYATTTYKNRFGSWNQALQQAMLDTNDISDSDLLRELERVAEELGMVPTADEMREHGAYRPVTYHRRFGGWVAALMEADFSKL